MSDELKHLERKLAEVDALKNSLEDIVKPAYTSGAADSTFRGNHEALLLHLWGLHTDIEDDIQEELENIRIMAVNHGHD